ncbi:hypothetical protein [Rufibacter psychrotolerans]|uniref:hypothetical protein n=1 Tax=Rufibacter psychrotolerans TaxID=2812556 RepID=UPI0019673506|nr:hypothetical protein [Rufibacter sp. SYSU D00308]
MRNKVLKKWAVSLLSFTLLVGAGACSSGPELNFDSQTWKSDLQGCKGARQTLLPQLEDIRLQLLGLHERDIRKLFGKPDAEELLQRSNKIYIYYIAPGPECAPAQPQAGTKQALTVRLDALGNIREAAILTE